MREIESELGFERFVRLEVGKDLQQGNLVGVV